MSMRSPRMLAGSVIVFLGLVLALIAGAVFGAGDSAVFHLALALSFFLFSASVFDFALPTWTNGVASLATGVLAAIFLAQGLADLTGNAAIARIAYGVLGQGLEGWLGIAFILWCVALLVGDTEGATRTFGVAVLAVVVGIEAYSVIVRSSGGVPPAILRLFDLLLFLWLAIESAKPAARRERLPSRA